MHFLIYNDFHQNMRLGESACKKPIADLAPFHEDGTLYASSLRMLNYISYCCPSRFVCSPSTLWRTHSYFFHFRSSTFRLYFLLLAAKAGISMQSPASMHFIAIFLFRIVMCGLCRSVQCTPHRPAHGLAGLPIRGIHGNFERGAHHVGRAESRLRISCVGDVCHHLWN
jgi:hypothetical protein